MDRHCGLLSLPIELLGQIVDYIVNPKLWKRSTLNWGYQFDNRKQIDSQSQDLLSHRTICSLRLVNKQLCAAASHALMPILRIHLNERSLSLAQEIINNKQIAVGIEGVQIIAACCPDNLVGDLWLFSQFKMEKFDRIRYDCSVRQQEIEFIPNYDSDADSEAARGLENGGTTASRQPRNIEDYSEQQKNDVKYYKLASERWERLSVAWESEASGDTDDNVTPYNVQDLQERTLLLKGLNRLLALHNEQYKLLATGSFATQIASILARLPTVKSVCLKDETGDIQDDERGLQLATGILDDEKVLQVLSEPMPWSSVAQVWNEEQNETENILSRVAAAALLWDLPIALSRAGVFIRGLHIQCFPLNQAYQLGTAANGFLKGTENEFSQSVSRLESFEFAPSVKSLYGVEGEFEQLSAERESQIINYIKLCTASRYLHNLYLNLEMFQDLEQTPSIDGKGTYLNLGNALDTMETTCLNSVYMENICISQDSMQSLCVRFAHQASRLRLNGIQLSGNGSWMGIMELLRSEMGTRVLQCECKLVLFDLESLEMYNFYRVQRPFLNVTHMT